MPLPEVQPLSDEDSQSLIFKAADFLNRTNSAVMGAGTELLRGGDPLAAVTGSLTGAKQYGGQDLMAQIAGGKPEDPMNRRVGLALDILNPLDLLNYVGFGGLTKAAKAIDRAALVGKGIAEQTRAGERGLLTLMGHRVPVPGDVQLMGLLGAAGQKIGESDLGLGVQRILGGRKGYLRATLDSALEREGMTLDQVVEPHDIANRVASTYNTPAKALLDQAQGMLKRDEYPDFLAMLDQAGNPSTLMDAKAKFIGSGPRAAQRAKAVELTDQWRGVLTEAAQTRDPQGIGRYISEDIGHVPRIYKGKDKSLLTPYFGDEKTGEIVHLEGLSNNAFNKDQLVDSMQPISRQTLTTQGQREFDKLVSNNPDHFTELSRNDPKAYTAWIQKYRMSINEGDKAIQDFSAGNISLEKNPFILMRDFQNQVMARVHTSTLLSELDRAGLTKAWDEIPKAEHGKYVRVDQGAYKDAPIGVPRIQEEAYNRFKEVYMPAPDKPILGEMAKAFLPKALQDLGLMPWWKVATIYGGGPGYFVRNFTTGVIKNYMDGMGPASFATHYAEAAKILREAIFKGLDPSKFEGVWKSAYGPEVSYQRIMEEYMNRQFHGGGSREGVISEIVGAADNLSSRVRDKVFKIPHGINARVEILNRVPLMLKTMEDTFAVAAAKGMQLPQAIGSIAQTPEKIGDLFDIAVTNAREAVLRQHFDYNDLTPFERRLRAGWIPFYTWLRKNIPNETMRMVHDSGKYMPFARYYYNSFEQQGVTPEDLPTWAGKTFVAPIAPDTEDRARWLDWTGFLPTLDVADLGQAMLGKPDIGQTRISDAVRYLAIRAHPGLLQLGEQLFQKDAFTGRSFTGDTPADFMGMTIGAPTRNLMDLFRPAVTIDQLNPGGIFGQAPRPHRNEPISDAERLTRLLTGFKVRATDRDEASMSVKQQVRHLQELRHAEQNALKQGDEKGAAFIHDKLLDVEKGLR
jgi:hypothetical protein